MLSDVSHVLNPNKAHGPDGLRGRVMKVCADQPWFFFHKVFPIALKHTFYASLVETIHYYAHCKKKLALENLMTFDQWHSHPHILLLNAWRDLYVTD